MYSGFGSGSHCPVCWFFLLRPTANRNFTTRLPVFGRVRGGSGLSVSRPISITLLKKAMDVAPGEVSRLGAAAPGLRGVLTHGTLARPRPPTSVGPPDGHSLPTSASGDRRGPRRGRSPPSSPPGTPPSTGGPPGRGPAGGPP